MIINFCNDTVNAFGSRILVVPTSIATVIKQKGETQNWCFKKTKHAKFSEKFSVSGGKKCSFFEKIGVICFLETRLLRFALLPYYQRLDIWSLH